MEKSVSFRSGNEVLRGILHTPDTPAAGAARRGAAVVFLHGWSGCRLGPHRMFVHAARELAAEGMAGLRFDFRGRGESDGAHAEGSIASMIADARQAIDFVLSASPADTIILLGICSGGKVAIGAAADDPRVGGLALWSCEPMGDLRDAMRNVRKSGFALREYVRKLGRRETWGRILRGRVNTRMVRKALLEQETAGEDEIRKEREMLKRFEAYRGKALFVYGSQDPETRQAGRGYAAFCTRCGIEGEFHEVAGAGHSFYSIAWEREVLDLTRSWCVRHAGAGSGITV